MGCTRGRQSSAGAEKQGFLVYLHAWKTDFPAMRLLPIVLPIVVCGITIFSFLYSKTLSGVCFGSNSAIYTRTGIHPPINAAPEWVGFEAMIDWLHLVHAPLSSSSAFVPASSSRDGFYCPTPLGGGGRRRRRPNKNLADMTSHPATYLLLLVNGVVYLYQNSWLLYILPPPVPSSSVTSSHETVMLSGSFYRIFTSSFSHVAFLHVFFNLSSLHNLRALEAGYGPLKFLDVVGALALGGGLAAPLVSRLQVRSTDTICMFLLATCFARRFAHPFACCFTRS